MVYRLSLVPTDGPCAAIGCSASSLLLHCCAHIGAGKRTYEVSNDFISTLTLNDK